MRTYLSPVGYDTRRVTRPAMNVGVNSGDQVVLIRPADESNRERATQTIADIEQFLQEVEPGVECSVERITTDSFGETTRACCELIATVDRSQELVVPLCGGPRDVLLPMTVASIVFAGRIDTALYFSDLDSTVEEWSLPQLTAQVPDRTLDTFEALARSDDWLSLSTIATETDQSKSTVIRHVNDLETIGVVESDTDGKSKRAQLNFSGELFGIAHGLQEM